MFNKWLLSALAAFAVLIGIAEGSRILAVLPTPSPSHHIWNRALVLALAKRGHHVTVLSPDPEKEAVPNYTHLNLEGSYEKVEQSFELVDMLVDGPIDNIRSMWKWGTELCGYQVNTKGFQQLIKMPQDSFDLVIMEVVFNECMYLLIHHFGGGTRESYAKVQEDFDLEGMINDGIVEKFRLMWLWGFKTCEHQMSTKGFKELLKMPSDSFDLIIMEVVSNECMFVLMHHFGGGTRIPVVGITAFGIGPWTDLGTGARTMPSVFVFPVLPYLSRMNFWERLYNTLVTATSTLGIKFYYLPQQHKIAENAYGKPVPPLDELAANISLILVNNHYVINGPQAELPSIIEVGGMQCSPPKPLPKDIKTFLDESDQGAIFFSLGSNLKSEVLPKERLQMLIDTFAALGPKIRVLWKFDPTVPIQNLPSNVMLRKWLPQEDVLGHPKILAFVSHSGLLSTQESIYHGVPIVSVPFFADQHTNAKRMVDMNVAKKVDFLTATKESFSQTILTVINDPSYRQNMKRMSSLFRDQPQTPLDQAVFWTEFAIRQNDNGRVNNLRSAGIQLAWYQYFLLDVFAFIVITSSTVLFIAFFIMKTVYRILRSLGSSKKSAKKSKKRQ